MYGHTIRKNKGNVAAMAKGVHAILKHYSSTIEVPQHDDCPTGKDSWCSYQKDLANNENTYRPAKNPIPPCIQKIITPIFDKLGSESFLQGCKNVASSNTNESFHHVLWSLTPKEQYNSSLEIEIAMHLAVCMFISGFAWTLKNVLKECFLPISDEMFKMFTKIDKERIANADYKTLENTKAKRKKERHSKNVLADAFIRDKGVTYSSGKFHTGVAAKK